MTDPDDSPVWCAGWVDLGLERPPKRRLAPAWWDGLWAAFYGIFVLGVLVGVAVGKLAYG